MPKFRVTSDCLPKELRSLRGEGTGALRCRDTNSGQFLFHWKLVGQALLAGMGRGEPPCTPYSSIYNYRSVALRAKRGERCPSRFQTSTCSPSRLCRGQGFFYLPLKWTPARPLAIARRPCCEHCCKPCCEPCCERVVNGRHHTLSCVMPCAQASTPHTYSSNFRIESRTRWIASDHRRMSNVTLWRCGGHHLSVDSSSPTTKDQVLAGAAAYRAFGRQSARPDCRRLHCCPWRSRQRR